MEEVVLTRKERLAERFRNRPFLRLLILSWPFRLAFLLFVGAVLGVAILLPKIWRATPPGFYPEIKISILDRLQCWSLKRNARRALDHKLYDLALQAWRSAWANNPGDLEALRGLVKTLENIEEPMEHISLTLQAGKWLLRLGHTNAVDLVDLARVYTRVGITIRAIQLMEKVPKPWPENLQRVYLIALFKSGDIRGFQRFLKEHPKLKDQMRAILNAPLPEHNDLNAEFALVSLAYLAGYAEDFATRREALMKLRSARDNMSTEMLAYDLEFILYITKRDVDRCQQLLGELMRLGRDRVAHHVTFWNLLIAEGRRKEAEQRIQKVNLVPTNAWEAYQLAKIYTILGLLDKANQLLRNYGRSVGWVIESLILRGELLIQKATLSASDQDRKNALDQLRDMALELRMVPEAEEKLGGYSYFLEGYANWESGAQLAAHQAFQSMVEEGIPDPRLAFTVAKHLIQIGVAEYAEPLLLAHRKELWDIAEYHKELLKCAYQLKHDSYLLDSAKKLYELAPKDPVAINNYAAALMIFHQKPTLAMRLTFELYNRYPTDPAAIINYATALVRNGRPKEAKPLLEEIVVEKLPLPDAAQYYLIGFEMYWMLQDYDRARYCLHHIDQSLLYPVQRKWLEDNLTRFEAEAARAEAVSTS